MNPKIIALLEQIDHLEGKLEDEFEKSRIELKVAGENGPVVFKPATLRQHLELKTGLLDYLLGLPFLFLLTVPVIYSMVVPIVLLDLAVMLYQAICFPIFGIERVRRRDYMVLDRRHLVYLNGLEKFNCLYCSYANGMIGFIREVTARTEKVWCPIKHAQRVHYAHSYYAKFSDYGDATAHRDWLDGFLEESILWPSRHKGRKLRKPDSASS